MSILHHSELAEENESHALYLDLFSTSQNGMCSEVAFCVKNPPQIAVPDSQHPGVAVVYQGCCNDWLCPRCGLIRAKHEYGRIVHGAELLADKGHELYFLTITTRGGGYSVKDALNNYYEQTNRLLSRLRADAKRRGLPWFYAQVTEYQKRKHPHSHILTSYHPADLRPGRRKKWLTRPDGSRGYEWQDCLLSDYLLRSVQDAGLGGMYDISKVQTPAAASRYIAKYLFKSCMADKWPPGWKRVRYSQSYPKLPKQQPNGYPLRKPEDWLKLASTALVVQAADEFVYGECEWHLRGHDVVIRRSAT